MENYRKKNLMFKPGLFVKKDLRTVFKMKFSSFKIKIMSTSFWQT